MITSSIGSTPEEMMLKRALRRIHDIQPIALSQQPSYITQCATSEDSEDSKNDSITNVLLTVEDEKRLAEEGINVGDGLAAYDDYRDDYGEFLQNDALLEDSNKRDHTQNVLSTKASGRYDENDGESGTFLMSCVSDRLSPLRCDTKNPSCLSEQGEFDPFSSSVRTALNPVEARKYFGEHARGRFNSRCHWIRKQCDISSVVSVQSPNKESLPKIRSSSRQSSLLSLQSYRSSSKSDKSGLSYPASRKILLKHNSPSSPQYSPLASPSTRRRNNRLKIEEENRQIASTMLIFDDRNDPDAEWYTSSDNFRSETARPFLVQSDLSQIIDQDRPGKQNPANLDTLNSPMDPSGLLIDFSLPEETRRVFDTLRAMTPDLNKQSERGSGLVEPSSPRSAYIVGCVAHRINPRASLVVRKKMTKELQLAHYGMGDEMAARLAESLKTLPYVADINVSDNNLTDAGLKPLIEAIVKMPQLLNLDLSENIVGPHSADAIGHYLSVPGCPLERLILRKANVDDFEGERFVNALMGNSVIRELDLSHNLLGHAELLNTVRPNLVTAAESIANLLRTPTCRLDTLKLSWNMIRLHSGVDLARSISKTSTLTYLDLSYNALGQEGGKVLGDSLLDNKSIKKLLLDNNNIDGIGCFVICTAIQENHGLRYLSLSGNPVGEAGAKALIMVPAVVGSRIELVAKGCNFDIRNPDFWFCEDNPSGFYRLDLTEPFQRSIAFKLLQLVANHHTLVITKAVYELPSPSGKGKPTLQSLELEQAMVKEKLEFLDDSQRELLSNLFKLKEASKNPDRVKKLFQSYDKDGSGEIDAAEMLSMCRAMGMNINESSIADIMNAFDMDGSGTIELPEFMTVVKNQYRDAVARIQELMEAPAMVLSDNKKVRYIPPRIGFLQLDVRDSFEKKKIYKVLTHSNETHMTELAKNSGDVSRMLSFAFQNCKIRILEALSLYETLIREIGNKATVLKKILPQMALPAEARLMVSKVTNDDPAEVARVKQALGPALRPIFGLPNGFYSLDLSKDVDRICLSKLLEISKTLSNKKRETNAVCPGRVGDTSLRGNWSSFRNEYFNGAPFEVTITAFTPMKKSGKLEFDFSGATRPLWGQSTLSDMKLTKLLINLALLDITDKDANIRELAAMKLGLDKTLNGDGITYTETSYAKAGIMGSTVTEFQNLLPQRGERLLQAYQNEEIKVDIHQNPSTSRMWQMESMTESDPLMRQESVTVGSYPDGQFVINSVNALPSSSVKSTRRMSMRDTASRASAYGRDNSVNIEQSLNRTVMRNSVAAIEKLPSFSYDNLQGEARDIAGAFLQIQTPIRVQNGENCTEQNSPFSSKQKTHHANRDPIYDMETIQEQRSAADNNDDSYHFERANVESASGSSGVFSDGANFIAEGAEQKDVNDGNMEKIHAQTRFRRIVRALLSHSDVSQEAKAARIVTILEDMLGAYWLRSRHLANIVELFEIGMVDKIQGFGTYRVELVVSLFSRVVDVHNFEVVMSKLSPEEAGCVVARLGWLNIFNPMKPEGSIDLNLGQWEDRVVAKILILLAVGESGDNFCNAKFQWDRQSDYIPGWVLPQLWLVDATMSTKGFLHVQYYSGEGRGLKGCTANVTLRRALLQTVLIDESEVRDEDIQEAPELADRVGEKHMIAQKDKFLNYLYPVQGSQQPIQDTTVSSPAPTQTSKLSAKVAPTAKKSKR